MTGMPGERIGPLLAQYSSAGFSRGRSAVVEAAWLVAQWLFVSSWLPGSAHRCWLLRLFGARIGHGAVIKPRVRIKFPWRLVVGEHSWIGEGAWIDNLAPVTIGANCCISQEAYLCTGNHNWRLRTFDLLAAPIVVKDGAWLAARTVVGPGVVVGEGAILGLGGVATNDIAEWTICAGVPAVEIGRRTME